MAPIEPRAFFRNFRDYDAPVAARLGLAARNLGRRFRTRRPCCGNHGQPGC